MLPKQFLPLVSECKAVGLELVVVDGVEKVCRLPPLVAAPALLVLVARGHQVSLQARLTRFQNCQTNENVMI